MKLENCPACMSASGWKGKKIGEPRTGRPDLLEEVHRSDEYIFTTAERYAPAVSDLRPAWSEDQLITQPPKPGERAPFGELCERHMKQVSCVAPLAGSYETVKTQEDAAQECFLNAFVHLKTFDGRSQFATWLTRIAINAALMKLRKSRKAREVPIDEPNPSSRTRSAAREFRYDASTIQEESCSLRERKRIVKSAISGLRPRARNVVGAHPAYKNIQSERPHTFWGFRPEQ